MPRKPFCRKSLAHSVVSTHIVMTKYLLICRLMLQMTNKFLFLSPIILQLLYYFWKTYVSKESTPILTWGGCSPQGITAQTYACNKAVVTDKGSLRKMLMLTIVWVLVLLPALQTWHFHTVKLQQEPLDLSDQASPHSGTSTLRISSFVDLGFSVLVPQEMLITELSP